MPRASQYTRLQMVRIHCPIPGAYAGDFKRKYGSNGSLSGHRAYAGSDRSRALEGAIVRPPDLAVRWEQRASQEAASARAARRRLPLTAPEQAHEHLEYPHCRQTRQPSWWINARKLQRGQRRGRAQVLAGEGSACLGCADFCSSAANRSIDSCATTSPSR